MVTTHVCHGQKPASKYIFRPSYDMRYRANKTKQEPPGNHFMEERLQIVKSKTNKQTNKQKRYGRSLDQQQIKACN